MVTEISLHSLWRDGGNGEADDFCDYLAFFCTCIPPKLSPLDQWLIHSYRAVQYSRTSTSWRRWLSRTDNHCLPVAPAALLGGTNVKPPASGNLSNRRWRKPTSPLTGQRKLCIAITDSRTESPNDVAVMWMATGPSKHHLMTEPLGSLCILCLDKMWIGSLFFLLLSLKALPEIWKHIVAVAALIQSIQAWLKSGL